MRLFYVFVLIFTIRAFAADTSELCGQLYKDQIEFSQNVISRTPSDTLTIIDWNAHKYEDPKFFWDLKTLAQDADVLTVQEAMHSTGWQNAFASHLGFSFSFFKSFCNSDDQATGVQTAARFPLLNNKNIVSRDTEPVSFTPKVTGLSRIEVPGHGEVVLVNTHALNFNLGALFERQIDQVVAILAQEKSPIIWAGDFNTWSPGRKDYLNKKAASLGLKHVDINNDPRSLILDHIYVRGFDVINAEVLPNKTSDHRPLKAVLKFK